MSAERIGIIGASGDLGRRLTTQACETYQTVHTFDIAPKPLEPGSEGIDAKVKHKRGSIQPVSLASIEEVIQTSSIIHLTAPISVAQEIGLLPKDSLLIFHNSVMSGSMEAIRARDAEQHSGQTAVVHCLMNERRRVVIARESHAADRAFEHFKQLGLSQHEGNGFHASLLGQYPIIY